jgi:TPR repeat protein
LCYENGDGVNKSERWARYWFKKAAEQGHEQAINKIENKTREKDRAQKKEAEL